MALGKYGSCKHLTSSVSSISRASAVLISTLRDTRYPITDVPPPIIFVFKLGRPDNQSGGSLEIPSNSDLGHLHALLGQIFDADEK
jgi:hypothetical protein